MEWSPPAWAHATRAPAEQLRLALLGPTALNRFLHTPPRLSIQLLITPVPQGTAEQYRTTVTSPATSKNAIAVGATLSAGLGLEAETTDSTVGGPACI